MNKRIKINSLKTKFNEKEKNILNALDNLLGEYDEAFDKRYMDHSSELEVFINEFLRKLIREILELEKTPHPELLECIR